MGLMITADESAPVPRPVTFRWECDGDHGFLSKPAHLDTSGDYVAAHHRLVELGWSSEFGRTLCPGCRR